MQREREPRTILLYCRCLSRVTQRESRVPSTRRQEAQPRRTIVAFLINWMWSFLGSDAAGCASPSPHAPPSLPPIPHLPSHWTPAHAPAGHTCTLSPARSPAPHCASRLAPAPSPHASPLSLFAHHRDVGAHVSAHPTRRRLSRRGCPGRPRGRGDLSAYVTASASTHRTCTRTGPQAHCGLRVGCPPCARGSASTRCRHYWRPLACGRHSRQRSAQRARRDHP